MSYTFKTMDEAAARAILTWRYDAPYDVYNINPSEADAALQSFLDPRNAYCTIAGEAAECVGFCCFGPDARVPGGDYAADALDVGLGLRPDLTGQGRGLAVLQAMLVFARATRAPAAFRLTVATFNARAQRVYERAGFRTAQTFAHAESGAPFVVMMRKG